MLTFLATFLKGISKIACWTGARWHMVDNRTVCVGTARVSTGVSALVPHTRLGSTTVRVEHTFGPAAQAVGVAEQARRTAARALRVFHPRYGAGAAGVGLTRIGGGGRGSRFHNI